MDLDLDEGQIGGVVTFQLPQDLTYVDSYQVKLSYGHPSVARPRVPNLRPQQTKASVQLIGDSVSAAWSSRN